MTRSSNDRAKRRAVKAASKKQAHAIASANQVDISQEVSTDPLVLGTKIAALEHSMQQLVNMVTHNHGEIRKAFMFSDAHLWVLRVLCEDIVSDRVVKLESGEVDMGSYYVKFNEHQQATAAAAAEAAKQEAPADEEPALSSLADDGGPEVFGGDQHGASA